MGRQIWQLGHKRSCHVTPCCLPAPIKHVPFKYRLLLAYFTIQNIDLDKLYPFICLAVQYISCSKKSIMYCPLNVYAILYFRQQ